MKAIAKSSRLYLRELAHADWREVYAYTGDEIVSKFQSWSPHSQQDARDWVGVAIANQQTSPRKSWYWGICLLQNNELMGGIGLDRIPENNSAEIGYSLNRKYWRQGFGGEAVLAAIGFIFSETSILRLEAYCRDTNIPSIRLLEKLHFRRERYLVEDVVVRGLKMSSYHYALTKSEYLSQTTSTSVQAALTPSRAGR